MTHTITPSIHWREGLFLRPHHLQAFARHVEARAVAGDSAGHPGWIGLASLEVDAEALERDVFAIDRAWVVFPDGTLASVPESAHVEQRPFADFFTEDSLDVFLGVKAIAPNVPVVRDEGAGHSRYSVELRELYDENEYDSSQEVECRRVQARVFFGDEDRAGFECVQLARLVREGRPEVRSVLSSDFVPPVLSIGASPVLVRRLEESLGLLRDQSRDLAASLPNMQSLKSTERGADISGLVKLQAVNTARAPLEHIQRMPHVHPWFLFETLVRAVGSLAVFGEGRVVPELPGYDHDHPSEGFGDLFTLLDSLAVAQVSTPYDMLEFAADPMRDGAYECDLDEPWLREDCSFYLAVALPEEARKAQELVARAVKLVAAEDIERVLQGVTKGIQLDFERRPPISFPSRPDLHFFRIETEGNSRDAWMKVVNARKALLLSTLKAKYAEVTFQLFVELPG